MPKDSLYRCRVCGWKAADAPWGENGNSPTFDYCDCCGVEFGYGDATPAAIRSTREQWIATGGKWAEESVKPAGWSLDKQLASIPEAYK